MAETKGLILAFMIFLVVIIIALILGSNIDLDNLYVKNLYVSGNMKYTGSYGYIWFYNLTGISAGTLNDTFQTLNVFNMGQRGFIGTDCVINSSKGFIISDSAVYRVNWISEGKGVQNHIYEGALFINENQEISLTEEAIGLANSEVRLNNVGILRLYAGDNLTIRIRDVGNSGAGSVSHVSLAVSKVGDIK
jgi:hypothetical protein